MLRSLVGSEMCIRDSNDNIGFNWALYAIYYTQKKLFALVKREGEVFKVKVNQNIDNWKVIEIGQDFIVIQYKKIVKTIKL